MSSAEGAKVRSLFCGEENEGMREDWRAKSKAVPRGGHKETVSDTNFANKSRRNEETSERLSKRGRGGAKS